MGDNKVVLVLDMDTDEWVELFKLYQSAGTLQVGGVPGMEQVMEDFASKLVAAILAVE